MRRHPRLCCADHPAARDLRHRPSQPGHRLDRVRRRLRRAHAPARSAQRVHAGAPRRAQHADALGAQAGGGAGAGVPPARDAARAGRDARALPAGRELGTGARGRPDDGPRGPRSGADRRQRRARGRDDRARTGAALHPRVTRAVRAGRAHARERGRAGAAGRAPGRRGHRGLRADLVHGDGRRRAAVGDRAGRRGRRGQPRRRAALGDRVGRRAAGHQQRHQAERGEPRLGRRRAGSPSSPRRWTPT